MNGTCHFREALINGWGFPPCYEQLINGVEFLFELRQNFPEFLHKSVLDGLPGADILVLLEEIECPLRGPQGAKGLIYELNGLLFHLVHIALEGSHQALPIRLLAGVEYVESDNLKRCY